MNCGVKGHVQHTVFAALQLVNQMIGRPVYGIGPH